MKSRNITGVLGIDKLLCLKNNQNVGKDTWDKKRNWRVNSTLPALAVASTKTHFNADVDGMQ